MHLLPGFQGVSVDCRNRQICRQPPCNSAKTTGLHSPSAVRVVYSDASETGYGGFVVEHGACISYGQWMAEQAKCSSTWCELSAVMAAVADKL